jgi:hypothetical protein
MPFVYDQSTSVYDDASYTYIGGIFRNASGAGTSGDVAATWTKWDPQNQYDEPIGSNSQPIAYDDAAWTYDGYITRNASGAGSGTGVTSQFKTVFKTGADSVVSSDVAIGLRTVPKSASGSGGATAGDYASGYTTRPRTAQDTGLSTSHAYGSRALLRAGTGAGTGASAIVVVVIPAIRRSSSGSGFGTSVSNCSHSRTASGAGISNQVAVRNVINIRVSASSGAGTTDVATWVNKGQPSLGKFILRPYWSNRKPYYTRG